MPKLRRRLMTATLSVIAGLLLLLPATGQAATVFGSRLKNAPGNTAGDCEIFTGPCTIASFIEPSEPAGDPYSGGAPVAGVITKFRIYAETATASPLSFLLAEVSRPNPADESTALASIVATGPKVTIKPTAEAEIMEFPARVPVKKGQQLAIETTAVQATYQSSSDKFSYFFSPPLVEGAGLRGSTEPTGELLVQATIEPDADGDGFGDETQDQCPSQKTTQGPCDNTPPAVSGLGVANGTLSYSLSEASTVSFQLEKKLHGRKVGKKCVKQTAKNSSHKRCNLFKPVGAAFSGPGNQGANQVTLPNGKKLGPGAYRVTMTVTDVAGNKATTTTTFTVLKKKRKH